MLIEENYTLTPDAILQKYYQHYHNFPDLLSEVPKIMIAELAQQLKVQPQINKTSSRSIDHFYALIRKYCKFSFAKKMHYMQLAQWIKDVLLPKQHMNHEDIRNQAILYFKKIGVDSFKEKSLSRTIKDATNAYENELIDTFYNALSPEQEANLQGLLLHYKEGLSNLGWLNKDFSNPTLDSMLKIIEQLSILNSCHCTL